MCGAYFCINEVKTLMLEKWRAFMNLLDGTGNLFDYLRRSFKKVINLQTAYTRADTNYLKILLCFIQIVVSN